MGFGLEVRKVPAEEIARRVDEAARMLDIEVLLDRLPKEMSGGQRQRVAMGRAIVRDPAVFLFDEPLSNLDASLRAQMRAELKGLHAWLGATMLYVTHDQVEAMTLADRICVLKSGVVQQVGTPQELFDHPANRFVAGFIGAPSMNFLEGTVAGGRLSGEGFNVVAPAGAADGMSLVLGLRPNDLELQEAGAESPALRGVVRLIEPMGWEAHVHLMVGDTQVLVRAESVQIAGLKVGETVALSARNPHYFGADEDGARVS